jgi:hypothetical protein
MNSKISLTFACAASCLTVLASAQTATFEKTQLAVSAGMNRYTEPGLMQLEGPEVGMHLRTRWSRLSQYQLEADVLLGSQRYTSESSGTLNHVANIETRWRAMRKVWLGNTPQSGISAGLAIHTLWNDLRGNTSADKYGYQRIATQLWLPVRWNSPYNWDIEGGLLIYGRHISKMSEVSTSYSDITNTQRRGRYLQAAYGFNLRNGDTVKPFMRYTYLGDSNTVTMANQNWIEPNSDRWQMGLIWEFNPR